MSTTSTYTAPHRLYWQESAEDEQRNQAEAERRSMAEQIADWAEEQNPTMYEGATIPAYIAIRSALICAALEGIEERKAS